MAYDTLETSVEDGQPIELYQFQLNGEYTRMTSSQNNVTIPTSGITYTAVSVSRSALSEEISNPGGNSFQVSMPADHDFVEQFRNIAPGQKAFLTLFRMHRADLGGSDEQVVIFSGTIRNVSYINNGRVAIINLQTLTSAYNRTIPRQTYQNLCNHMLYDERCTLNKNDVAFSFTGTVSAVSGDTITVTGAGAFNALADFFEAGYIESNNDFRTVTLQSTDVLTVITPFLTSPLGESVIVRAGCKHRISTDCVDKFNNLTNFGGFAYVPKKNPFATGLD